MFLTMPGAVAVNTLSANCCLRWARICSFWAILSSTSASSLLASSRKRFFRLTRLASASFSAFSARITSDRLTSRNWTVPLPARLPLLPAAPPLPGYAILHSDPPGAAGRAPFPPWQFQKMLSLLHQIQVSMHLSPPPSGGYPLPSVLQAFASTSRTAARIFV